MKTLFSEQDAAYMRRALALARRGQGLVEPNPMVGAVVVRGGGVGRAGRAGPGGGIVGEGWHHRFGAAHAEVEALAAAARRACGATLYVTLEPCCHWGKTPPCTDAILAAGISRVVAAMIDPFAQVHGKGARLLRRQGLRVDIGLLQAEARALNAPFLTRLAERRPFIIAKWAQSLDGRIATASGQSQWISSEHSRGTVHTLRGRVDGIVVGITTALRDDPLLTARPRNPRDLRRIATRIVLDSHCRLPLSSRLVHTIADAPLLVVHQSALHGAAERRRQALIGRGVQTLAVPADAHGRLRLLPFLRHAASQEYANLLVEGGSEVLASFFGAGFIDEAHVFIAPMVIGGKGAPGAVGGADIQKLSAATQLTITSAERSGPDLHVTLRRPVV